MKKMFCVVAVFASVMQLWAKTERVDGITWSYREADGIFTSLAIVGLGSNGSVNSTAINTATKGAIQIPASLGGLPVEEIERYAFYDCTNITSVTIPIGVKSIGNQAFYNCTNLISVTLPDSLSSIGSSAFGNCVNLKNVLMPLKYTGSTDEIPMSATITRYKSSQYVTLDANGGLLPWSGSTDYVSAYRIPVRYNSTYGSTSAVSGFQEPFRDGYSFAGWMLNGKVITADTINVELDDHRLLAQWTPNKYTVTFNANGGQGGINVVQDCGSELIAPTVSREFHTFAGWVPDVAATVPASNVTYTAQWRLNQYTVFFDANGGTCDQNETVVEHDSNIGTLPIAEREDADFAGWYLDGGHGMEVDAGTVVFGEMTLYAQWRPLRPVVVPDIAVFENTSQRVSIDCATDGATIFYTTDGSNPKVNGREYTKPFTIYKSCTVRAIAVKYDWKDSEEATATFTRGESLSEAANLYGYTMETDSAAPWTVDAAVSHDGASSVRSGAIGNNGTTYLMASVRKAGTVSFWWKAQCEELDEEDGEDGYYDYGAFLVNDVVKARIAGNDTGWRFVSVEVPAGGKHVLRWEYRKDGATTYVPDCVWLDQVQWVPADGSGYTLTSPEPVPYSWLSQYGLGVASGDFEAAANAAGGKTQGGAATSVWEEFVAGTDPTNALSVFTAKIEMREGVPVVTWEPDLNESGMKSERLYKIYGRESLTEGGWQYPTNALHRFFKVTVEMP